MLRYWSLTCRTSIGKARYTKEWASLTQSGRNVGGKLDYGLVALNVAFRGLGIRVQGYETVVS